MPRDVSIMVSAKDGYSEAILKMQKTQTAFRKDLGQLDKELKAFSANKVTLKTDLAKAKSELSAAEKAFKSTGDEAARLQMEAAQADYDNIRSNLDLVSKAAKKTEQDMQSLTGTFSKTENRISGGSKGAGALETLAKAGIANMLGQTLSNVTGAAVTSAMGTDAGDMFGSILSGTATGAAMGSVIPGIGTAVGAVAGFATGAIEGITKKKQKADDVYRASVEDIYTSAQEGRAEQLSTGSSIAATRETRQMSFATLLGGDEAAADKYINEMRAFAEKTPFGEDALAGMSKTLLAYKYDVSELLPLMTAVGDAGSALGLDAQGLSDVATYLGRMKATGQATREYLNPLLERGIPVFDYLSTALGKSNEEVQKMLKKGLIPGAKAAEIIADYMGGNFAGEMDKQGRTYAGIMSNLEDIQMGIDAAMGEGFNDERKKGIQEQIDFLSGASGEQMKEANRLIGTYEASKINEQEKVLRDAVSDTLAQIEAEGITNEVEVGRRLQEAQAKAKIAYATGEQAKQEHEAQMQLLQSVQESVGPEYYQMGYEFGQQLSKGVLGGYEIPKLPPPVFDAAAGEFGAYTPPTQSHSGAYGFNRIPYDGFPIMAHANERLLTAAQARQQDSGGGAMGGVSVSGNNFSIREEADIDKVATALYEKIVTKQQGYIGEGTG